MNLRPDQLDAHLAKPLAPLYVLHGDEPLLILEAGDAIRACAHKQGFSEREVLVVSQHFKWDALTLAAGNLSLFGGDKLIDLRIPTGKPGREGAEALQRYAGALPPGTVTLVSLPLMDWKARKNLWFSALTEAGTTFELNAPPLAQLPSWVAQRLARQKQSATQDALDFIAGHVEGNLLAAHQEIQKLGLLYPEGQLSTEQVRAAVLNVARYDVDKLRAALLSGDVARCARLLEGLRGEGVAPLQILWALSSDAHALAAASSAREAGSDVAQALKVEKVFDRQRARMIETAAQRMRAGAWRTAALHAARIDRMVKGLTQGDVWDELLQLVLRMCGAGMKEGKR